MIAIFSIQKILRVDKLENDRFSFEENISHFSFVTKINMNGTISTPDKDNMKLR